MDSTSDGSGRKQRMSHKTRFTRVLIIICALPMALLSFQYVSSTVPTQNYEPLDQGPQYAPFQYHHEIYEERDRTTGIRKASIVQNTLRVELLRRQRHLQPSGIFLVQAGSWDAEIDWSRYPVIEFDEMWIGNAICLKTIVLNHKPRPIEWKAVDLDQLPYNATDGELLFDSAAYLIETKIPDELISPLASGTLLPIVSFGSKDYPAALALVNLRDIDSRPRVPLMAPLLALPQRQPAGK